MIGLKDQCFGVEVEMTGITREQERLAAATAEILFLFAAGLAGLRQPVQATVLAEQGRLVPEPGERAFADRLELQPRNDP